MNEPTDKDLSMERDRAIIVAWLEAKGISGTVARAVATDCASLTARRFSQDIEIEELKRANHSA